MVGGAAKRGGTDRGEVRCFAIAAVAGLAHTAAFAPLELWWLQILSLSMLFWLLLRKSPRRAAGLGLAFGFAWFASGLWWLFISMHRYGGMPAPLAALAVALLALALSSYLALAMAAFARWQNGQTWHDLLLFTALCLLAELARATWFSGTPWLASGYAHTSGPLAAWAPWIGVYGLGSLAAAAAAGLVIAVQDRAVVSPVSEARGRVPKQATSPVVTGMPGLWRPLRRAMPALVLLLLIGLPQVLPAAFTTPTGRLSVSLLQPNVAQDLKFDASQMAQNFERLAKAMESARGTLVVTPESVVPLPLSVVEPEVWLRLQKAVSQPGRAALVGIFVGDEQQGYTNSMVALSSTLDGRGGSHYRYGKQHLLPFGEFIPFGFGWFVRALRIPLDDQASGRNSLPFVLGTQRLRPLICYEDLFGEDIVGSAVGDGAATIFVNASNLAWFGTLMVQDQHLQFSRMRALEFERPFIRSTNTGATSVIDHHGRVTARLPADVAGVLEAEVEGRRGITPYARWLSAVGLWPLWALALAVIGWAVVRSVTARSVPGHPAPAASTTTERRR